MSKPAYRLKHLILRKYGEEKYELGCQLVAQFVGQGSKAEWTAIKIHKLCETGESQFIDIRDKQKLKQLFGVENFSEFYTENQ